MQTMMLLVSSMLGHRKPDIHKHAKFSCEMDKLGRLVSHSFDTRDGTREIPAGRGGSEMNGQIAMQEHKRP